MIDQMYWDIYSRLALEINALKKLTANVKCGMIQKTFPVIWQGRPETIYCSLCHIA